MGWSDSAEVIEALPFSGGFGGFGAGFGLGLTPLSREGGRACCS